MHPTIYTRHDSAFGPLLLLARDGYLTGVYFADQLHAPAIDIAWRRDDDDVLFAQTVREISEFASGERHAFSLPFAGVGTPFQKQVWREIAAIPFGETRSYGEIASRLGAFARAVGSAAGRNPLSLVVPCHRVVGANGALTGYAGGLERKRRLLELESAAAFASCSAVAA
jgi:methylated-DNA-[protein]-cysteine S-methyltransferase